MAQRVNRPERPRRAPRPLDPAALSELALGYAARFATTAAKLERYLTRKLRERGWDGDQPPDTAAITERLVALGFVDDAAFAEARTRSLLRRGYGERRIGQALAEAGIGREERARLRPGEVPARAAALALARKRRLGPFGPAPADRAGREKQLAAMLRAGHRLDSAREMVDAPTIAAAEQWAAGADDDES
ncbi:MAG: RecX family transcriptional regulator [Croceibacterium sp.]